MATSCCTVAKFIMVWLHEFFFSCMIAWRLINRCVYLFCGMVVKKLDIRSTRPEPTKKKVVALYGRTTDLYAWPYEFLFEQTLTIICKGRRRTTPQVLGQWHKHVPLTANKSDKNNSFFFFLRGFFSLLLY